MPTFKASKSLHAVTLLALLMGGLQTVAAFGADTNVKIAEPTLSPYRADYSAKFSGLSIEAVQRLEEIAPGIYRESLVAKNFLGKIDEQSTFSLTDDQQLQPTEYHYIRSILGSTKTEVQNFDWQNKRIEYHKNEQLKEADLQPGQLDMITHRLQLRRDLKAGRKNLSYAVISRGKLKKYQYKIVAEEVLQTAIGPLNTIKIEKVSDDDREFTAWLASDWDYLIVKLVQSQNGDSHKLELRSAVVNNQTVLPLGTEYQNQEQQTDDEKLDGSRL